ncbi:MAG: hypothetical protein ACE37B_11835 [Ilumatobacter sp.]|jgi:hypothetical protein|uniref:hypothetical protein n=1 Tax=Ilumatobacter sp. TaxID=1967498 RepID=UPI00391DF690
MPFPKPPVPKSSFPQWLRSNSEHYLLQDSQARIADRQGIAGPKKPKGMKDRFFRQVFAPIYRRIPWSVRRRLIHALPGSHRQEWPPLEHEPQKPAI